MVDKIQAELNIGVVGHVDHGKTSLTSKLTNKWTDSHSDELKQGISIRLGYADANFYKCEKCEGLQGYTVNQKCLLCGSKTKLVRKVSFVDAPGHETLMAIMLSGATLLNGAVLVIAANEDCPQPRTLEHLSALKMHGIKNIVVAQNKIDLVSKKQALENYNKIRNFLDKEGYTHSPIIPTSANFDTNIDALIYALINYIQKPKFDTSAPLKMQVVRSFDINKPGTSIKNLKGGVLGGSILQGSISVGSEVYLYPGINKPIKFKVKSLNSGGINFKKATPGGLIAVGTDLDPAFCFSDRMVGQLICEKDSIPEISSDITISYSIIKRLIEQNKRPINVNERLVVIIGSAAYLGTVLKIKKDDITLRLNKEAVYYKDDTIAISRNINNRWRLSGYGKIH